MAIINTPNVDLQLKTDRKTELENIIKSGSFSASDAREYNQITGSDRGARDLAISTPTANTKLNTTFDQTDYNVWNKSKGNTGTIVDTSSGALPLVTGIDDKGNSIYENNKTLNGGTGTTGNTGGTGTTEKTPLELAQEQIAKQQAEIDRKNKEYEVLQNKGAESELAAGVVPGMSGKSEQTDFYKGISNTMTVNYQNELANLEKAKQDLQKQLSGNGLTKEGQAQVLAPYDQFLDKITKLKELNKQASQREQEDLKTRYNQTISRQQKANELSKINAEKIAAITGVGFTSGGIQGINNIIEEGTQAITDLEQARESMLSKYQTADKQLDIEYLDTLTTVQRESQSALQNAYNSVTTQIQALDTAKSKASKEYLEGVKGIAKEYFDVLNKQWDQDFKVMDFNYKKYLDYKKDVRDQETITRDQNKQTLDLITKGDLTGLTDEDILTMGDDMGLDTGAIKGLILQREQQKSDKAQEVKKLEMTPYQQAQYELDKQKLGLDQAKFNLENGQNDTTTTGMRTDRNNNPTAMTTDVAKTLGLQEGVDYIQGDPFKTASGGTLYTAKLNGNPIDTTIKALDLAANSENKSAFYSGTGAQRWTHTAMTDEQWLALTPEQKKQKVAEMYKNEGGSGILNSNTPFIGGGQNINDYVNLIVNQAGGLSKVSDTEAKNIKQQAKEWIAQGLSPQEAYLKYKGFNIGKDKLNISQSYLNMGDTLLKDIKPNNFEQKISSYLEKGDTKATSNYVTSLLEADVSKRYGNDTIPFSSLKTQTQNINTLINLINKNKDKIGLVAGTAENIIAKFKGTPEYTQIKALLQMSQADIRKNFAGSAVTETEMKALENFIGGTEKMNSDNLITQLQTLNDKTRREYENQRSIYGIKPANIYLGGTKAETIPTTGQTGTGGNLTDAIRNRLKK